jgi:hypothetical protein
MERKVIQIAATDTDGSTSQSVYALCEDGTMWHGYWAKGGLKWDQIPNVPQPEEVKS